MQADLLLRLWGSFWAQVTLVLKRLCSLLNGLAQRTLPFHAEAWATIYEPVNAILNEPDAQLQMQLTALWKEGMISQLNIIIITVCSRLYILQDPLL